MSFYLEQEITSHDLHSRELIHFVIFYDIMIVRPGHCICPWPNKRKSKYKINICLCLSIRIGVTNSNISSFSSSCFNSFRDKRCGRPEFECDTPFVTWIEHEFCSFCGLILKKVGVPSIVFTIGFNRPPRSNSCAEIFLIPK